MRRAAVALVFGVPALGGLAACAAPEPHLAVGIGPGGATVSPSVATTAGPLRLGLGPNGARVSTGLGPLGLGLAL